MHSSAFSFWLHNSMLSEMIPLARSFCWISFQIPPLTLNFGPIWKFPGLRSKSDLYYQGARWHRTETADAYGWWSGRNPSTKHVCRRGQTGWIVCRIAVNGSDVCDKKPLSGNTPFNDHDDNARTLPEDTRKHDWLKLRGDGVDVQKIQRRLTDYMLCCRRH